MSTGSGQDETAVAVCARHGNDPALLIEILHDVQEELGHVPDRLLPSIAKHLNLARAEVHGVRSFYHDFRTEPAAGVVVKLCQAEACQAMGAVALGDAIRGNPDVSVEPVYCLGNCALAPAGTVAGRLIGRLDAERLTAAVAKAAS